MQTRSETNEITVVRIRERLSQRAGTAVVGVGDCYHDSASLHRHRAKQQQAT
jgi:hypothetical protein